MHEYGEAARIGIEVLEVMHLHLHRLHALRRVEPSFGHVSRGDILKLGMDAPSHFAGTGMVLGGENAPVFPVEFNDHPRFEFRGRSHGRLL